MSHILPEWAYDGRVVWWIFFTLGMGTLMGWNSVITADQFIGQQLASVTASAGLVDTWVFAFTILVGGVVVNYYGDQYAFVTRFFVGYIVCIAGLVAMPAALMWARAVVAFGTVVTTVAVLGFADAVVEA